MQSQSSYGPVISPMNKVHGGMNKLPSVNQLVGQPNQHGTNTAPGMMPMGKNMYHSFISIIYKQPQAKKQPKSHRSWCFILFLWSCNSVISSSVPGSGMMNNHSMQANGEMNGAHSSQSMVSGSHCTPPPPYNADPSLVRYACVSVVNPLLGCHPFLHEFNVDTSSVN